ncbi:unnamed protein product, partial [Hapterophycus canaliculatus]
LEEDEAARRIQRRLRKDIKRKALRASRDDYSRKVAGGGRGVLEHDAVAGRIQSRVRRRRTRRDWDQEEEQLVGLRGRNMIMMGTSLERRVPTHAAGTNPAARSPSPSHQRHERSTPWLSPGKAAATAAAAAAKEAAKAAAASVRAAEAAADAAEAAEAAAEAEEELQLSQPQSQPQSQSRSQGFRPPPAEQYFEEEQQRERQRQCSPARSAFYLTEGGREEEAERLEAEGTPKSRRYDASSVRGTGGEAGNRGGDGRRGYVEEGGEDRNRKRGEVGGSAGSEEQMLKRARDQARRHARDRRARARAKEEESKRELQVVQAELAKAEELRDRQAMVEKSALEAKRARVLEDMKRRQLRLRRLQEEEGQLGRRGDSHPSSPSRSSSTDAAANEGLHRRGPMRREAGGDAPYPSADEMADGDVATALSLPPLARSGGEGVGEWRAARPGRKPRHVSAFRERILEERRVRKEVDLLKRKELEDRHSRQVEYAAKVR